MIRILGPLEVDGVTSRAVGGPRPAGLLAALAVEFPRAISRDRLVELLWHDPPPKATAAVHVYISQLRRALGPTSATVERISTGYRLVGPDDIVDAARVEAALGRARLLLADGHSIEVRRALDGLDEALRLFRGPPLEGLTSQPFAPPAAERLAELRLQTALLKVSCQLELGLEPAAIADLDHLLDDHPYVEELWGRCALALYRANRQHDALETLQRARRLLAEDLGVEPGPALRDLERAILVHDPSLQRCADPEVTAVASDLGTAWARRRPASQANDSTATARRVSAERGSDGAGTPPGGRRARVPAAADAGIAAGAAAAAAAGAAAAAAGGRRYGTWPAYTTSFLGRDRELGLLGNLLQAHRLLTVVGPAGIGKSRLVTELEAHPPPGTTLPASRVFVDVMGRSTIEELAAAFALALGESAVASGVDPLCRLLGGSRWLVIVDRCEQATPALAPVLGALLERCPATQVLCTSRQALGAPTERVFELPPLVGETGNAADRPDIELFLARARRRASELSDAEWQALLAVADHLDGLPLAIEIAACAAGSLPLVELPGRLRGALGLTLAPEPGVDPDLRHSSLRAALRSSHELLGEPARALLRALAVFPGNFAIGDLEDLLERAGSPRLEAALPLHELVGASLVPRPHPNRRRPYRLLDGVRLFAAELLDEDRAEAAALRGAHAQSQLELVAWAAPALDGPEPARCAELLDEAEPDLVTAAAWLGVNGAREAAAEIELLLARHFLDRYRLTEGHRLAAAAAADPDLGAAIRARAAWLLASFAVLGDRYEEAGRACASGIELARELGGRPLGLLLTRLAEVVRTRDQDRARAAELLGEAEMLARTLEDRRLDAEIARVRHMIAWDEGRFEEAERLGRHWRRLASSLQDARGVAEASVHLGAVLLARGLVAAADTQFERASAFFAESGDPFAVAYLVYCRARAAQELGRHDEAHALATEGYRHFSVLGDAFGRSLTIRARGETAHALCRLEAAEADLREAMELADGPGYTDDFALAANALARLLLDTAGKAEAILLCEQGLDALGPEQPSRLRGPLLATLSRALLAEGRSREAEAALGKATEECRRTRWATALAQLAEAEAAWRQHPSSTRGRPRRVDPNLDPESDALLSGS